jgi:hypothetical protein
VPWRHGHTETWIRCLASLVIQCSFCWHVIQYKTEESVLHYLTSVHFPWIQLLLFLTGDCLLDNLKMEMWAGLILTPGVLTTAILVAEDSLFIATVLMQYSVGNENRSTFVWSHIFVLLVYQFITILPYQATQWVQIIYKALKIFSQPCSQKKKPYYKQIHDNIHTSSHQLKVQHQTNAPLPPTCPPPLKAQTVHQLLRRHNSTLLVLKVKDNSVITDNNFWTRISAPRPPSNKLYCFRIFMGTLPKSGIS